MSDEFTSEALISFFRRAYEPKQMSESVPCTSPNWPVRQLEDGAVMFVEPIRKVPDDYSEGEQ